MIIPQPSDLEILRMKSALEIKIATLINDFIVQSGVDIERIEVYPQYTNSAYPRIALAQLKRED